MRRLMIALLILMLFTSAVVAGPAKHVKPPVGYKGLELRMDKNGLEDYIDTNKLAVRNVDDYTKYLYYFSVNDEKSDWQRIGCEGEGKTKECYYILGAAVSMNNGIISAILLQSDDFTASDFKRGLIDWCQFAKYVISNKYGKANKEVDLNNLNILHVGSGAVNIASWSIGKDVIWLRINFNDFKYNSYIMLFDDSIAEEEIKSKRNKRPEF